MIILVRGGVFTRVLLSGRLSCVCIAW
jgi:hypothetical protein